jgi:tetratricopeptide (TPR) repeat protein
MVPPPAEVEAEAEVEIPVSLDLEESGIEPPEEEGAAELPSLDFEVEAGDELPQRFVDEPEPILEEELAPPLAPERPGGFATEAETEIHLASEEEEISFEEQEPPPPPSAPAPPEPVRAKPVAREPVVAEAPRVPVDLQRVLDEVDSYISLGFVDDAKDALKEISSRYPSHAAIAAKVAELGLDLEEAPPVETRAPRPPAKAPVLAPEEPLFDLGPAGPEPTPPEPEAPLFGVESEPVLPPEPSPSEALGGIDLGAELGQLFEAQSAVDEAPAETSETDLGDAGLADIFKEFKKGVDKQLGKEDYDTRYNLGIAYKEMGLVDEAIAEFQLAAKDENRILECSSMLGICFMEKGMPKLAVKWFEKGLKAAGRSPEEYQGLRYDLAMAHEAAGEADTALELFSEVHGENAGFRDVAAKLRDLKAARG